MREIKFRAYIKALKKMINDFSVNPDGTIGIEQDDFLNQIGEGYYTDGDSLRPVTDHSCIMPLLMGDEWIWLEKEQFELMQYTGLKDKNNREIYECDILLLDEMPYSGCGGQKVPVYFIGGGFYLNGGLPINQNGFGIEVIGNIYESPELLK